MKSLTSYINESGISNAERSYREFCQMCAAHNLDPKDLCVEETPRHNWKVLKNDKKVFLVSRYILNPDVISKYDIKTRS